MFRNYDGAGSSFGIDRSGAKGKAMVEFVSANPTGPLHVGHGRGAAVGDCMARVLDAAGWQVSKEFYYNDAGNQIANLGVSVQARARGIAPGDAGWPEDGYRGDYIADVAKSYLAGDTVTADDRAVTAKADAEDLDAIREFAVAYLRREQDLDLRAFGVKFDVYYLESSLYTEGKVDSTVAALQASGHTYEQDDALWLRTTGFGDDKDRVMRKREGGYTYFVPDVAYHVSKWNRGFVRVINEQGADHHGTIARVRAGLQALDIGVPKGWPEYVLHQMVTVMRGGEEVKLSKRAGSYVTLRDLIDEAGCDATRYFLVARKSDSQLIFDIDLARAQTNDNPVYYIQYAHARVCSVMNTWTEAGGDEAELLKADLARLGRGVGLDAGEADRDARARRDHHHAAIALGLDAYRVDAEVDEEDAGAHGTDIGGDGALQVAVEIGGHLEHVAGIHFAGIFCARGNDGLPRGVEAFGEIVLEDHGTRGFRSGRGGDVVVLFVEDENGTGIGFQHHWFVRREQSGALFQLGHGEGEQLRLRRIAAQRFPVLKCLG